MEVLHLDDRERFNDPFMPQILKVSQEYKVPLICMTAGQEIPPHPSGTGVFYIVRGKGVMTLEGKETEVRAGTMVFVDKGESRGIRATEELIAFAVHVNS